MNHATQAQFITQTPSVPADQTEFNYPSNKQGCIPLKVLNRITISWIAFILCIPCNVIVPHIKSLMLRHRLRACCDTPPHSTSTSECGGLHFAEAYIFGQKELK